MNNTNNENSRRQFLGKVAGLTAVTIGANVTCLPVLATLTQTEALANERMASGRMNEDLENALFQQIGQLKLELDLRNGVVD